MRVHQRQENPFAHYEFISAIELFSPYSLHVENCPIDEAPMLVRITFKEILRNEASRPEAIMEDCVKTIVLMMLTTGLPLDAIPSDYRVDGDRLTLTYYQHEGLRDRSLHYNVLSGYFLVLFRELHSHWRISEDTVIAEYDEIPTLAHSKRSVA